MQGEAILNMVEVFKTNICQQKQAKQVYTLLSRQFPLYQINFDLQDCDNILRVEGTDICTETIITMLNEQGYDCEVLV